MAEKKKPKFKRKDVHKYSKLGKGRKKKQIWRKPTGRHNKMRNQMKGHPATVSIGYSSDKDSRGKIEGKTPVTINNVKDLSKMGKENIAVMGKIGKKKKMEIVKKAQEMKIEVYKTNPKKFLKKNEKVKKEKTETKKEEKSKSKENKK